MSALASVMQGEDPSSDAVGQAQTKKSNPYYDLIADEVSEFYSDSLYMSRMRYILKNYPNEITVVLNILSYVTMALFCKRIWDLFWRFVKFLTS